MVALDISLTDDLIAEGTARELVNRIQNIRKTKDFDVTDRIDVHIEDHEIIRDAITKFSDYIKSEVLATDISLDDAKGGEQVEITDTVQLRVFVAKA